MNHIGNATKDFGKTDGNPACILDCGELMDSTSAEPPSQTIQLIATEYESPFDPNWFLFLYLLIVAVQPTNIKLSGQFNALRHQAMSGAPTCQELLKRTQLFC